MRFDCALLSLFLAGLIGCGNGEDERQRAVSEAPEATRTAGTPNPDARWYKHVQVQRGERLYADYCAQCHGNNGQGAFNWRQRDADGKFPSPPLNGTGHTWHHPIGVLHHVIKNGSPGGQGNMPAWKDTLTDDDIIDVIAWIQSAWPDEIYASWLGINARAAQQ